MFQNRISTRSSRKQRNNNPNQHDANDTYKTTGRVNQDESQQQQQYNNNNNNQQQRKDMSLTKTITPPKIITDWQTCNERGNSFDRKYDLTPVDDNHRNNNTNNKSGKRTTPSYTIDPFEFSPCSTPKKKTSDLMRYVFTPTTVVKQ
jgi:hypothetical protein